MKDLLRIKSLRDAYARRDEPENVRRLADTYWMTILFFSIAAIIGGVTYGAWQFFVPPPVAAAVPTKGKGGIVGFEQKKLNEIVKAFEKRQADFEALITK